MFNTNELSATWEDGFFDDDWEPDTLNLTDSEKKIIEDLKSFLPRHMPVYDWNLPYAEKIILILRKHAAQQNMHSDASPTDDEQSEDTSGEAPVM